ncbi:hypothetical protein A5661_14375 [Mycobacterium asiaticum]|nr:hypothetical protein A5661_14375 [Mycobacterium asiaticum]
MWHRGHLLWDGSLVLTLAAVVFGALLISAVVLAVRYLISSQGTGAVPGAGSSRAESLLAERFARGEIGDDEYQRKLRLLHQHR